MSLNFETVSLGEHLYIKGRIGWKGLKKEEYLDQGDYRIINATALEEEGINWDDCGYISKERFEESPEIILKDKDILISKDGTIGKLGYVKNLEMDSTVASGIFVVRNQNEEYIDTDFLYYYFKSPFFKWFIKSVTEGSVIPHLYQRDFTDMEFNLFDLDTQKKCSSILNAIEEKINVNRKINKNLDNQMYLLFNNYFLKFVSSNENNDLDIPDGWKFKKLSEFVIKSNTGADAIKKAPIVDYDTGIKCIRTGDLSNNRSFEEWGYADISEGNYDKYKLSKGDIIVARTGTASLGLNRFIMEDLNAVYNNGLIRLKIDYSKISHLFLYGYLNSYIYKKYIEAITIETSTRPNMKINYLINFKMLCPPYNIQQKYEGLTKNMLFLKYKLEKEILSLNKLRDVLLPKLMSGEIDISKINCDF
ncbi:restriction endonuclease subunit S [Methanobrevibacter sp.]|uniref:restriction endonuclease subunit S n=1 Tax=Methanobrevibacter sp. TaxID=66852 RepID=UPI0038669BEB